MEQDEMELSPLVSLQSLGRSESSDTLSLGEIPSNVVQAMGLAMVDEFGQCSEQRCLVSSSSSSLSEDVSPNLGSDHSPSVWSVDPVTTTCDAETWVDSFMLLYDQFDEELAIDLIVQGTSNIMSESLIASHPEIADSLIYRSLLIGGTLPQTGQGAADKVRETVIIFHPQSFDLEAQPSQSVQAVDACTTACRAAQPSQAPERQVGCSFKKTLKKLFCQPLTSENSPQVVSVATSSSGAELNQGSDQEPRRPLHVRVFRAVQKSFRKTFCCLGNRTMVQE